MITDEMVEAFGRAWHATPAGEPGARRRAGLAAALESLPSEYRVMYQREGEEPRLWLGHLGFQGAAETQAAIARHEGRWGEVWVERRQVTPWEKP